MREKAEAVKAERDGLRREVDVLAETLRAMTAGLHERKEQHREERSYVVSRMINAGCSSEWLWVEQSIVEALTNVVRYLNAPAERTA